MTENIQNNKPKNLVSSHDGCPFFSERRADSIPRKECWYCKYAEFKLTEKVALEVGHCCYPKIVIK